ncbi:MAG: MATE family efflux transporter [Polyangiales bacterium]
MTSLAPPSSRLLRLALPVVGLNVVGVLTLAIDTALAGRLVASEQALSALALATHVVVFANVVVMGFTVGAAALIARAHGAGDRARLAHVFDEATKLVLALGVAVAVAGTLGAERLLEGLGASGGGARLGATYVRPMFAFSFVYYLFLLYAAAMRAVGRTLLPFVVAVVTAVVHVVLAIGWMFGRFGLPPVGLAGAAYATVASQLLAVTGVGFVLARGAVPGLEPRLPTPSLDRVVVATLLRVGAPAALDLALVNLRFLALVAILAPHGAAVLAAHGVGIRIQSLAFVPGLAIAQATSALVGQALGASAVEDARRIVRASVALATLVMTALGALLVLAASPLAQAFHLHRGSEAHLLAVEWIRILGAGMPLVGLQIALVGALRGAGATGTSLRLNFVGTGLVLVPVALVFDALDLGPLYVWSAFPIALAVMAALAFVAYRRGRWATVGVDVRG